VLQAQSTLVLSSGSAPAGGNVSLNFTLTSPSGSEPAAIEWTFALPAAVASFTVQPGSPLASAAKTLDCAGTAAAYICVATGLNRNAIANGVVATLNVTLGATNAASAPIGVSASLAA